MHTTENRYNYKHFKNRIFNKILTGELPYTSLIKWFEDRLLTDSDAITKSIDANKIAKLIHFRIPKMQRQNLHNPDQYLNDLWLMWIIATWDMYHIQHAQLYKGIYHYNLDWVDDEEEERLLFNAAEYEPLTEPEEGCYYDSIPDNVDLTQPVTDLGTEIKLQ